MFFVCTRYCFFVFNFFRFIVSCTFIPSFTSFTYLYFTTMTNFTSSFLTHNEISDVDSFNNITPIPLVQQNENFEPVLYQGKIFTTWQQAFETIEGWAKQQGFNIVYNRVERNSARTFRKRSIQCEYQGSY